MEEVADVPSTTTAAARRHVSDYLRMPRAEFMATMRQAFPGQIEGMDRRLDQYLTVWRKTRRFIPKQDEADNLYLTWVLSRVPGLRWEQKNLLLTTLRLPPDELMQPVLDVLDTLIAYRSGQRDLAAVINGEDNYTGDDLERLMQADRDRLRDFIRTFARLKRNQVDLTNETWASAPDNVRLPAIARRDLHIACYENTVNHPWLDETDAKGRKRSRGEKETIVTGLLNNGPQPRTIEDERWRQWDKRQCMEDAFNTIVEQHDLVRAAWSGHPIAPIWDAGEPNRFGRAEENKRADMRLPYVKEPFHRVSPFGIWDPPQIAVPVPALVPQAATGGEGAGAGGAGGE
jgi:hypothetical protein